MQNQRGKKVLYLITKSNWGGAQAYVYTLAVRAKQEGAEVVVAFGGTGLPGAASGRLADTLRDAGIRTIFIKAFTRDIHTQREFSLLAEIRSVLRAERPDILHLNSSKAGGVGALAGRLEKIPCIIFTSHGLAYDEDTSLTTRTFRWVATWFTFVLSHAVIVISTNTFERAQRFPFCSKKVHLIYNGLRPLTLWPRDEARKHLLSGSRGEKIWIGTIAELTRNKSLDTLVSAAANLKQRGHVFTLVIIGEGEERPLLTRMIQQANLEDTVHLAGFVADAANLLTAFDIFALVSTKEGLPYVLLEAGAARCAVVATRIPGTTDIITKNTGLLVTSKSVKETADALEVLLTNGTKRQELAHELHHKVVDVFSLERMVDQTFTLYR